MRWYRSEVHAYTCIIKEVHVYAFMQVCPRKTACKNNVFWTKGPWGCNTQPPPPPPPPPCIHPWESKHWSTLSHKLLNTPGREKKLGEQVNQKLLYRESDWWYVGLVVQKARKQGTVC